MDSVTSVGFRALRGKFLANMRLAHILATVGTLGAVALLYAFDPATTSFFPSCPFRLLTGWSCPLCGTLRAAHALLHGHFGAALHHNPFVLALGLVFTGAAASDRVRGPGAPSTIARVSSPSALVIIAIAATAFTIARNLPMPSFVWIP